MPLKGKEKKGGWDETLGQGGKKEGQSKERSPLLVPRKTDSSSLRAESLSFRKSILGEGGYHTKSIFHNVMQRSKKDGSKKKERERAPSEAPEKKSLPSREITGKNVPSASVDAGKFWERKRTRRAPTFPNSRTREYELKIVKGGETAFRKGDLIS